VRYTGLDNSFCFSIADNNQTLRRLNNDRFFMDGLIGIARFSPWSRAG
jgi:hypothetical protein